MQSEKSFRVRQMKFEELNGEILKSWESLEERALESNAYLSPRFVIPALRHLAKPGKSEQTLFVFVERTNGTVFDLVGAGVFVKTPANRNLPLPHLRAFRSLHSYLSGILVDRDWAEDTIRAFFRFFCESDPPWHGVEFEYRPADGPQAELIASVSREFDSPWTEQERMIRSVFVPSEGGEGYLQERLSSSRLKEMRRMRRRLEDQGEVRWRVIFDNDVDEQSVERFLAVEHMGWKAQHGTSLRARPAHEAFFREMVQGFRDKPVPGLFFTEMALNDVVIASTSNLISGGVGFAFKIGWDPQYAKMSPGLLNEAEFIQQAPTLCGSLSYVDSGAMEGSFIDQFWAGRRALTSGVFGTTPLGRKGIWGVTQLRRAKRWGLSHLRRGKK